MGDVIYGLDFSSRFCCPQSQAQKAGPAELLVIQAILAIAAIPD
jgi:hypothetical protein